MEKKHPFHIKLQSKNIDFVEVSIDLIPQYLDLSNNPNISKLYEIEPIQYCYEDKLNWVNGKLSTHAETFSMIERNTGKFMGNVEFYVNGSLKCRDLGISLLEEYQDKHYGTEAIETMIQYGFQQLHLEEIHLVVFSNNKRAIHCYKKLGFVEYRVCQNVGIRDNEPVDDIYMKLVNPEITLKDTNQCKEEGVMKFTDNFSEETKAKAEELKQQDLENEKERLTNELIEQMGPHLVREGDKYRKSGMKEAEVEAAIQKKANEILNSYQNSIENLKYGIKLLKMLNNLYDKKDEIMENRGR